MRESMKDLKNCGIIMTPQRIAVWKYVKENTTHPTAEDVYKNIIENFPNISLATIYSILQTLKESGLVRELFIYGSKSVFDPNTEVHHHFLCKNCDQIFDIDFECELASQ